jgi:hypothetical protein
LADTNQTCKHSITAGNLVFNQRFCSIGGLLAELLPAIIEKLLKLQFKLMFIGYATNHLFKQTYIPLKIPA